MFEGFVFLDLETTGLDPVMDQILEVGILVLDKEFETLSEFNEVCYFDLELNKAGIDQYVIDMHTRNGLWDDCKNNGCSPREVEKSAIAFLQDNDWQKQPMAGNTIFFDRKFLRNQMPNLENTFHYRSIDVSSFRNVFTIYGVELGGPYIESDNGIHRSIPDCYHSAEGLRYYLRRMGVDV